MRYFVFFLFLTSCASADYVVESDYSYKAKFHRYKTFDFAFVNGFEGSTEEAELIKKYAGNILTSWGYKQDSKKPDIYIYYALFYDDLDMIGYNQQELRHWSGLYKWYRQEIQENDSLVAFTDNQLESESEYYSRDDKYTPIIKKMGEGTLLISFFDRKKARTVWQGYASGYFGKNGIKSERVLRSAVIRIMDEFRLPSAST